MIISDMKIEKRIVFVGPVKSDFPPTNGETAKNQQLFEFLNDTYTRVILVDTINWKRDLFTLIKLVKLLYINRNVHFIFSICTISAYRISCFIKYFVPKKRNDFFYFVIGNTLPGGIAQGNFKVATYSFYKKIFVEGLSSTVILNNLKMSNVVHLPNFKKFAKSENCNINVRNEEPSVLKFVFLSRINQSKGVSLILDAWEVLNELGYGKEIEISFFGPEDEDRIFMDTFKKRVSTIQNSQYLGYLNLNNLVSYDVLANYNMMIFPSIWRGEGFPGVFVDAFISGIPVMASDWNLNSEVVLDGVNGLLIEPNSSSAIVENVIRILENKKILVSMSEKAFESSFKFSRDKVLGTHLFE